MGFRLSRERRFLARLAIGAAAILASCTFPDPSFLDSLPDSGGGDGGPSDGSLGGDGNATGDAGDGGAKDSDAEIIADGSGPGDEIDADKDACDKDLDTYFAVSCGGTDCDDDLALRHPNQ